MTATSADVLPLCATVAEEVEQMLTSALDIFWDKRDFMRVCVSQSAIDHGVGHVIGDHLNGNKIRFFAERLRHHQELGRIRPDVDVAAIALALSGLNLAAGFFAQIAFGMNRKEVRAGVIEMARVISRGLVASVESAAEALDADEPPVIIVNAGRRVRARTTREPGAPARGVATGRKGTP